METVGDKKKSRPPLGNIGNTQGQMSPEEDIKNMKFKVDVLEGALECQAKLNVVSEQRRKKLKQAEVELRKVKKGITDSDALHQKDLAALKAKDEEMRTKDEEMRTMKENMEAAKREIEALKKKEADALKKEADALKKEAEARAALKKKAAEAQAALRKKDENREMDKAFLKTKDELLEKIAIGLKNSDEDQVRAAAFRALCESLETAKNKEHQMELERDEALKGRQVALKQRDDAKMQYEAYVAAHLDDMGRLLRG
ncbi:uncharacterized protein LOC144883369 isoform X1 [Branchiostoma floridae x Branchiostoma japonicum]